MARRKKVEPGEIQGIELRSSAAEFLSFTASSGEQGIEVLFQDEMIWATQKMIAELFDCTIQNVGQHLKDLYECDELNAKATIKDFFTVQTEGTRQVERSRKFYRLDAIIAVGYRVNSDKAVQFRQWAADILSEYTIKGYVMDGERMKNGAFLGVDYYEHLLEEIREIRISERRLYQKVTDIYATAVDYNVDAPTTRQFFATVQNKMHYAVHGSTAAEVIMERADAEKDHMGLRTWRNAPAGKIVKSDVSVAKNYLNKNEMKSLELIVTMYLDYAERQAMRNIPMTMQDWAQRLDAFLRFNEEEVLDNPGKVAAEVAKAFAESEFEKYRMRQDRLYQSDFDRFLQELESEPDDKSVGSIMEPTGSETSVSARIAQTGISEEAYEDMNYQEFLESSKSPDEYPSE